MSWPYTAVNGPPNADSGFVVLGSGFSDVPNINDGIFWPVSGYVFNPTGFKVTFSLRDGNGDAMLPDIDIEAGESFDLPASWFGMNVQAIMQWKGNNLVARMWGYQ